MNELIPNEDMTHNEIDLEKDILQNILLNFLEKNPNKVKNNHFNLFERNLRIFLISLFQFKNIY